MLRLTLIHPCIGRRAGERLGSSVRTWQMEPLWAAALAAGTPRDAEVRFYDDRLESIPYNAPTDLVGISVETYTARRGYQIASEYRRRGVPVVMGGFHATLCPEEVAEYAEAVVVGEGEETWPRVVDDFRSGRLQKFYRASGTASLQGLRFARDIFGGKHYLPIRLIEVGRGCRLACEFCAVQAAFGGTHRQRPVDEVLAEVAACRNGSRLIFFVDDNLACDPECTKEFLRALIPLRVRWVGQAGISIAHDRELLELLGRSGCRCLLIGFESLHAANLREMHKPINTANGGMARAVAELRRQRVPVYGTFVFGYDADTVDSFQRTVDFAVRQGFLMAAFAHMTPFPGTPLYRRMAAENRLLYPRWWLDKQYGGYNTVVFQPRGLSPAELRRHCLNARRAFFSWGNMVRRGLAATHRRDLDHLRTFWMVNLLHRADINLRDGHPLGDESWQGQLLKAR